MAKNNIGLAPRGPIRGCSCKQEMGGRDYANPITESPEIFLQPWILEGKGGEEGVFSSFWIDGKFWDEREIGVMEWEEMGVSRLSIAGVYDLRER